MHFSLGDNAKHSDSTNRILNFYKIKRKGINGFHYTTCWIDRNNNNKSL